MNLLFAELDSSPSNYVLQISLAVLFFIVILIGAYYVSRFIGSMQIKKSGNKNIRIIESVGVAPQKILQIVQVGKQYYLIGVTKENIVFLHEVDGEELELHNSDFKKASLPFSKVLEDWMSKKKK